VPERKSILSVPVIKFSKAAKATPEENTTMRVIAASNVTVRLIRVPFLVWPPVYTAYFRGEV
jgi:hypothetical protein